MYITCNPDNWPSRKTLEYLDGEFLEIAELPEDNDMRVEDGMLKEGADTFWELYNPKNPNESPYGGTIVNSYCHAWSCGPTYFLRKYFYN